MKRKLLSIIFAVISMLPLGCMLTACLGFGQVGTVTYLSVMPTVYEADLIEQDSEGNTYQYSVIKRKERIDGAEYSVFYGKYNTSIVDNEQEWLCIWHEDTQEWENYRWTQDEESNVYTWERGVMWTTFDEVNRVATYASYTNTVGVQFKKSDLVKQTDEYLEYTWGATGSADVLRISNNEYHICLYHKYYRSDGSDVYDRFTKFTFEQSTSPIPHMAEFAFAEE